MKVLIGSCGGLTGSYLARKLSEEQAIELHGFDITEMVATREFVDKLHILPRASSPEFISRLCALLQKEDIKYYLPTHSVETREVSKHETEIRALAPNARFIVSPIETFNALDDKESLFYSLENEGIPTPRLLGSDNVTDINYPLFMKRRVGSGGSGSMLVPNKGIHKAFRESFPDALFFEYIEGPELTIDCMFDESGRLLGTSPRLRERMLGGAAIVSRTCKTDFDNDLIARMASRWTFKGCINVQCIVCNGTPYVTDVNLRYPSGGLPLTVKSGMNVPLLILRLLRGEHLEPFDCKVDDVDRTMLRWLDEVYVEGNCDAIRI